MLSEVGCEEEMDKTPSTRKEGRREGRKEEGTVLACRVQDSSLIKRLAPGRREGRKEGRRDGVGLSRAGLQFEYHLLGKRRR